MAYCLDFFIIIIIIRRSFSFYLTTSLERRSCKAEALECPAKAEAKPDKCPAAAEAKCPASVDACVVSSSSSSMLVQRLCSFFVLFQNDLSRYVVRTYVDCLLVQRWCTLVQKMDWIDVSPLQVRRCDDSGGRGDLFPTPFPFPFPLIEAIAAWLA